MFLSIIFTVKSVETRFENFYETRLLYKLVGAAKKKKLRFSGISRINYASRVVSTEVTVDFMHALT